MFKCQQIPEISNIMMVKQNGETQNQVWCLSMRADASNLQSSVLTVSGNDDTGDIF